jgi:hypothetical protein
MSARATERWSMVLALPALVGLWRLRVGATPVPRMHLFMHFVHLMHSLSSPGGARHSLAASSEPLYRRNVTIYRDVPHCQVVAQSTRSEPAFP